MAKVITGKVRFSYVNVFQPKSINGSEPKYSISLLIPKTDKATVDAINKAIDEAIREGVGKFSGKIPARAALKVPLRDGDAERPDDPSYAGMYFLNATSKTAPGVIDRQHNDLSLDQSEFYSGCWGRASINFYAFNTSGNKGIACGLNNLQKLEDGDNLSGRASADSDFGDDEDIL